MNKAGSSFGKTLGDPRTYPKTLEGVGGGGTVALQDLLLESSGSNSYCIGFLTEPEPFNSSWVAGEQAQDTLQL